MLNIFCEINMRTRTLFLVTVLSLIFLVGCVRPEAEAIVVTNAWGPEPPPVAQNGIFYMDIANNTSGSERLLNVNADVCGATELHESFDKGDGLMGMRPLADGVEIPAKESVSFAVGGMHIMCLDKEDSYKVGDTIPLLLTFSKAGTIVVHAEIR